MVLEMKLYYGSRNTSWHNHCTKIVYTRTVWKVLRNVECTRWESYIINSFNRTWFIPLIEWFVLICSCQRPNIRYYSEITRILWIQDQHHSRLLQVSLLKKKGIPVNKGFYHEHAAKCNFENSTEDLLRSQIVFGIFDENTRKRLLVSSNLTLRIAIVITQIKKNLWNETP